MHTNDQFLVGIEGINHPKRTYDIVEGFIRRGYSDETIRMILGGILSEPRRSSGSIEVTLLHSTFNLLHFSVLLSGQDTGRKCRM